MAGRASTASEPPRGATGAHYGRIGVRSALATGVCLGVAAGLPFWRALVVSTLPAYERAMFETTPAAQIFPALWPVVIVAGGVAWGWALARITGHPHARRLALAGGMGVAVGYLLATAVVVPSFTSGFSTGQPPHVEFGIIFVLATGVAAAVTGTALGVAVRSWQATASLTLAGGVGAAVPAALVAVCLDLLGMRVGSGDAAMPKVAALGFLAASLAVGAAMGLVLTRHIGRKAAHIPGR